MGAIGGILIADYWVLPRQALALSDLFKTDVAALVLAILPVAPGFVRAATTPGGQVANPGLFDHLYTYAWFVTFALSFVVYLGAIRGRATSR